MNRSSQSKMMLAIWLENGNLSVRSDVPVPAPPPGEALVRVLQAGICNTDLELPRGYYPYTGILGHEFVGEVVDGPSELQGRRVVGEINAVCGTCRHCMAGRRNHCSQRTVLGIVERPGAFAQFLTLPVHNLHAVPDTLSTDAATFTEPLAAALEIREQVAMGPGDHVIVIGDGKLGQLIAQVLTLSGCDLTVLCRYPEKSQLLTAREIHVITSSETKQGFYDVVVEATGNPEGFHLARRLVRPRGTVVLKSTYANDVTFDISSIVVDEITLVGSRCGPFAPALKLLDEGRVDIASLIDARYPLSEGLAAFSHANRPGAMKVLLEIQSCSSSDSS